MTVDFYFLDPTARFSGTLGSDGRRKDLAKSGCGVGCKHGWVRQEHLRRPLNKIDLL